MRPWIVNHSIVIWFLEQVGDNFYKGEKLSNVDAMYSKNLGVGERSMVTALSSSVWVEWIHSRGLNSKRIVSEAKITRKPSDLISEV